ncbi:alpha/beta hydrolase [Verrucomicrobiota bacterium]
MPDRRLIYKTIEDVQLSLDVFLPEERDASSTLPGILFFHGGGWNSGNPSQFHPHCQYFASRGMVAMSAEYRLAERHGTTPYECVTDGKSAIRWIRLNATDLGIDPDNLVAGGGSAGGHVAAATATVTGFEDESDDNSISPKPEALVLFNPVFDNGPGGFGHDRVKERWQAFSPMHNIAEGVPPAIVFLGTKDPLLPVSTAAAFKRRMNEAGTRCEVWTYNDQKHAFFNYRDGNNPYYDATVHEADRFMASLGYLDGEPTLQNTEVEARRL